MTATTLADQFITDPQETESALIELIDQYMQRQQPARVSCCTDALSVYEWLRKHAPYAGRLQVIQAAYDATVEPWGEAFAGALRAYCYSRVA